jgi:hypothetical protein
MFGAARHIDFRMSDQTCQCSASKGAAWRVDEISESSSMLWHSNRTTLTGLRLGKGRQEPPLLRRRKLSCGGETETGQRLAHRFDIDRIQA